MGRRKLEVYVAPDKRDLLDPNSDISVLGFVLMPSTFQPTLKLDSEFSFDSALASAACLRQQLYGDATNLWAFKDALRHANIDINIIQPLEPENRKEFLDDFGAVARSFISNARKIEQAKSEQRLAK